MRIYAEGVAMSEYNILFSIKTVASVKTFQTLFLIISLLALFPITSPAITLTERPIQNDYTNAVGMGTECGKGIEERIITTGNTNRVLPRVSFMKNIIACMDGSIFSLLPGFVDHTKKSGGTYDSWFASKSNVNLVVPPSWSTTGVFTEAHIGDSVNGRFSWSSDGNYTGPVNITNLCERITLLSMMQETYIAGSFSNRYSIDESYSETLAVEEYYGNYTNVDYLPLLYNLLPWAYIPSGWTLDFATDWGATNTFMLCNIHYLHELTKTSSTNLIAFPLACVRVRQIYNQYEQAGLLYHLWDPSYYECPPMHYMQWLYGLACTRSENAKGAVDGHIFRLGNANASGIYGDVDVYLRNGTASYNGSISVNPTNFCRRYSAYSNICGDQNVYVPLSVSPAICNPSLVYTNVSYTNWVSTDELGSWGQEQGSWAGPSGTSATYSASISSGPIVTKWNFGMCKP